MPYINYDRDKNVPGQAQGLTTGGVLGQGAGVGGNQQRTSAGTPGGWYNVQDFLAANPQEPLVKQRIQERGEGILSGAEQSLAQSQAGVQDLPQATGYDPSQFQSIREGGVTADEASQMGGYLGQQYTPTQTIGESTGAAEQIGSMQPGFGGLMDWYGNIEKPSAEYTPGMQKMDELLLRGQQEFVKDYPTQLQESYQSRVGAPMQKAQEDLKGRQQKRQEEFSQAGTNWFEGIQDFLSGEQSKVEPILGQLQQEEAARAAMDPSQMGTTQHRAMANEYEGLNIGDYYTYNPSEPTRQQAAFQALGGTQGGLDYNMLSDLLAQQDDTYTYDPIATQGGYTPGSWAFDEGGFKGRYDQLYAQEQSDIQAQKEEVLTQLQQEYEANKIRAGRNQGSAAFLAPPAPPTIEDVKLAPSDPIRNYTGMGIGIDEGVTSDIGLIDSRDPQSYLFGKPRTPVKGGGVRRI